tara:strand:+ start:277 stop:456 length:180 start_codon:yes stop_codon:yes gene_type:complete
VQVVPVDPKMEMAVVVVTLLQLLHSKAVLEYIGSLLEMEVDLQAISPQIEVVAVVLTGH